MVVLSLGEAIWSPRCYDYTMSIAPEVRPSVCLSVHCPPTETHTALDLVLYVVQCTMRVCVYALVLCACEHKYARVACVDYTNLCSPSSHVRKKEWTVDLVRPES